MNLKQQSLPICSVPDTLLSVQDMTVAHVQTLTSRISESKIKTACNMAGSHPVSFHKAESRKYAFLPKFVCWPVAL